MMTNLYDIMKDACEDFPDKCRGCNNDGKCDLMAFSSSLQRKGYVKLDNLTGLLNNEQRLDLIQRLIDVVRTDYPRMSDPYATPQQYEEYEKLKDCGLAKLHDIYLSYQFKKYNITDGKIWNGWWNEIEGIQLNSVIPQPEIQDKFLSANIKDGKIYVVYSFRGVDHLVQYFVVNDENELIFYDKFITGIT